MERDKNLLRKFLSEGVPRDTAHADPEVQSEEDELESLPILQAECVFGMEHEMGDLVLKCCNPNERIQLSAIPILGAGGIGKTTLARLVYGERWVQEHFELRAWVKMDGQDFRPHHAARQILMKLGMGMAFSEDDQLDEMVRDALRGRRCLIVFDGVESMAEGLWLHIKKFWFDSVDLGSKVLLTTSSEVVANLVGKEPLVMKKLSPYEGLSLYRNVSFDTSGKGAWHVINNLSSLCGCIPLLIKLLGDTARYDKKLRKLLHQRPHLHAVAPSSFDASAVVLLCLWALPPQLKQCLAFCAVFPKGYALDRVKIINLWAAHGLVKPSPESNQLQDIGDSYFQQLLYFFTDIATNEYGDITDFRMPGLIHKIMQDVAGIVWKGKVGVIGSISEDARRLSLDSELAAEDVTTLISSPSLYSGAMASSSLGHLLLDFQELQSVDLSCSGIRNLSDDICALRELRYLNLSYTLIETLPDSITNLSRLQTLDLSWCYHFKVLPKAMHSLKYMSHLDLSQCESLSHLPSGIGLLVSLTSMPLFVLGKDHDCAQLGELGLLNELRGRLEIRNLENVKETGEARDAKLNQKQLNHLVLSWSKDDSNSFEVLELLEPNQQLKVVDITGYMASAFPQWISSMSCLIKISITDCGCVELPSLGRLPLLKELQLKGMTNIQYIGQEFYGDGVKGAFPSLEQLGLYDMPKLLEWSDANDDPFASPMCRSLKTLSVEGCHLLYHIPSFGNLRDLIVCDSNDMILLSLNHTRFGSLSSLLIKNMELGNFLQGSTGWRSLKKLILFNTTNYFNNQELEMWEFTDIELLSITHCTQVSKITLGATCCIRKLHVVDCPSLEIISFKQEATELTEMVVDGCPELHCPKAIHSTLCSVSKLMIRSSDEFIRGRDFMKLKKLRYLSIRECPWLERELDLRPSRVSHIPCVVLGDHKAKDKLDSNKFMHIVPGKNKGSLGRIPRTTVPVSKIKESWLWLWADLLTGR